MTKFGWDYPPGCHGTPWDEPDPPCEICGEDPYDCICPECPVCHTHGDPRCYLDHGLRRSEEQKFNLEVHQRFWEEENRLTREAEDRDWREWQKYIEQEAKS